MKIHKQTNGAVSVELSSADLARLRKGWEVLEELAHYGRNDNLLGEGEEKFSGDFLEKTADDVATILAGVSPGSASDGD